MRKALVFFSSAAVLATALIVMGGGTASADPGGGATIHKDFGGCGAFFPGVIRVFTTGGIEVDSASGNTTLICHFTACDIVFGSPPTTTFRFVGWPCTTFAGRTTHSVFQMNPDGNAFLRCKIEAST